MEGYRAELEQERPPLTVWIQGAATQLTVSVISVSAGLGMSETDLFKNGDVAIYVRFLILFLLWFFGFERAFYYVAQGGLRVIFPSVGVPGMCHHTKADSFSKCLELFCCFCLLVFKSKF